MTAYVDRIMPCVPNRRWRWDKSCHLFADSVDELHTFALRLGLKRAWFQSGRLPHYDLTVGVRTRAIRAGARELVTSEEWKAVVNRLRTEGVKKP